MNWNRGVTGLPPSPPPTQLKGAFQKEAGEGGSSTGTLGSPDTVWGDWDAASLSPRVVNTENCGTIRFGVPGQRWGPSPRPHRGPALPLPVQPQPGLLSLPSQPAHSPAATQPAPAQTHTCPARTCPART